MTLTGRVRLRRVLGVVENENFAARGLRSNDARILRHVPGTVDFAFVVDLDLDFDLAADRSKTAEF